MRSWRVSSANRFSSAIFRSQNNFARRRLSPPFAIADNLLMNTLRAEWKLLVELETKINLKLPPRAENSGRYLLTNTEKAARERVSSSMKVKLTRGPSEPVERNIGNFSGK